MIYMQCVCRVGFLVILWWVVVVVVIRYTVHRWSIIGGV